MQEYTSPGEVAVPADENLLQPLWDWARTAPDRPLLARRAGDEFVDVTAAQFADTVTELAAGLIGLGLEPGSRVCLLSRTRIEWTYLDYAIWAAGCVTVPIYETSSPGQVEWIVDDSGAVAILVEDDGLANVYGQVAGRLDACEHRFTIEGGGLDDLRAHGAGVAADDVVKRADAVTAEDLATIVYTSGTTGRPKGCLLTHGNLAWDARQVQVAARDFFTEGDSTLLFLPLAHIFARVIQTSCITIGAKLGFSTGVDNLTEELGIFRPTFLLSVPRVFEKVHTRAQQRAHAEGKGRIFDRAAQVAIDYSRASQAGRVGLATRLQHALFDRLVYARLRDAVGGRIRGAISGGAALGERLGHFFNGVGLPIYEGYGLTETTAGATINRPDAFKIGTVGRPLPGCTVRLADDGEVLLHGGNIFRGYHRNDEATAESLDPDGWLRTGDLGELDPQGFLRITGRKKELIVTAGGKNVAPAVLEDALRAHPLVSQSMVVGEGEKFIAALVALDPEELPRWAERHGKAGRRVAELADDPELQTEIQAAVDDANTVVSRAEAIREFRIVPEDFSIEGGELTPTLKVKRPVVADRYRGLIEAMYGRG